MKLDLHVHTINSIDSINTPSMIIKHALKKGLDGIAITDHDTLGGIDAVRDIAPEGFFVIPGAEYSTDFGHMLALFCDESAEHFDKSDEGLYSFNQIADFVRGEGGLLVAAHPLRYKRYLSIGSPYNMNPQMLQRVDGIECVNARDLQREVSAQSVIESCAEEYGLFVTGGSDAHLPMEIGGGYTEFPYCCNVEELKEALIAKKTTAHGIPGKKIYMAASRIWKVIR